MKEKIDRINKAIKESEKLKELEKIGKRQNTYVIMGMISILVFVVSLIPVFGSILSKNYYPLIIELILFVLLIAFIKFINYKCSEETDPLNTIKEIFNSEIPEADQEKLLDYFIKECEEEILKIPEYPIKLTYDFKKQIFTYDKSITKKMVDKVRITIYNYFKEESYYIKKILEHEENIDKLYKKITNIINNIIQNKNNYIITMPDHNEVFIVDCKNRIKLMVEKDEYLMKEFNNYISYGAKYHQKHNKLDGIVYQDPFEYHNFFIKNDYFKKTKKILEETIRTKNEKSEELINSLAQNIGEDLSKYYQFKEVHKILTYYPVKIHGEEYNNHCWKCHSDISSSINKQCNVCGWFICNKCHSCSPSHKK